MTKYRAPRTLLAFALALGGLPSAAAAEELPKYWVFGTELPAPPPAPKGPTALAAPGAENGKLAQYDYPGEYAQRFDGVDQGAMKPKRHFSGFVSRFSAGGRAK